LIWSAHLSALFRELPYLERPAAAAEAGFTAVETWWPEDGLGPAWAAETRRLGLDVSLVNCFGGDLAAGERGFLNDPERRDEALDAFRAALDLADRCGARAINALVGRDSGSFDRLTQLAIAADALAACAELAADTDVTIVVEPLNELDVPGSLVPTPRSALALVEDVGAPNVRLLYDAYHAACAGYDPVREVADFMPLIGHVQFADCPGRGAPGSGDLDLDAFVAALEAAGYTGAVGLEFFADGPTRDSLGFMRLDGGFRSGGAGFAGAGSGDL
jgi:hydroxypyruvate isomerase